MKKYLALFLILALSLGLCSCFSGGVPETDTSSAQAQSTKDSDAPPVTKHFHYDMELELLYRLMTEDLPQLEPLVYKNSGGAINEKNDVTSFWEKVFTTEFPAVPEDETMMSFEYYPRSKFVFYLRFTLDGWNVSFYYYPLDTSSSSPSQGKGTLSVFGKPVVLHELRDSPGYYGVFNHNWCSIRVSFVPQEGTTGLPETPINVGGIRVDNSGKLVLNLRLKSDEEWMQGQRLIDVSYLFGVPDYRGEDSFAYKRPDGKLLKLKYSPAPLNGPFVVETVSVAEFSDEPWYEISAWDYLSVVAERIPLQELLDFGLNPVYYNSENQIVYQMENGSYGFLNLKTIPGKEGFVGRHTQGYGTQNSVDPDWKPWDPAAFGLPPS